MKTYTILLAQDVPHYGTAEIKAADAGQALERIAAIPLCGESLSDQALRAEFIFASEYDIGLDAFEPSANTEGSYVRDAVEVARNALTSLPPTRSPGHSGIRVFVRGGVLQGAETLDGTPTLVDVVDYDVDGCDPARLATDRDGEPCSILTT